MPNKSAKTQMTSLFETTAIRAAALIVTNLLFIVEFQFDMESLIHIISLSLFSLSIPLLATIVLADNMWKSGYHFEESTKNYHFGHIHNIGSLLSIIAIALCIFSYHLVPGILFTLGCFYSLSVFAGIMGVDFKERINNSKKKDKT